MIFFINNSGTIIHDLPEQVYQGSANANSIYVVAPFARNLTATVAFGLPNGVFTKPSNLSYTGEITGFTDEQGTSYYGWSYEIPNDITAMYGTVIAQFTFYSGGRLLATSSTTFTVGRGIPPIMPETPTEDIYEQILQLISSIQQDLGNGYYTARAVYAWNSMYKYGANELVYYPTGEYGVYVKSLVANNTQPPYTNGVIGSNWRLIVDFNNIMNAQAEIAESVAKAAQSATDAASSASSASNSANSAAQSAAKASNQANAAQASASAAAGSEKAAAESATEVRQALGKYYTKIEIDGSVAKTLEVSIDNITYEMDFVLKSADGTVLSANKIDLPLESVVVSGRYDTATKTIILTLQNGQTVSIPIGDLVDGLASQEALDDVIDGTTPVAKAVRADTAANADNANKVTNSLTIITDGVPTEYNGGTAKEVVINTTSSTDPEAVHYTPQNLTAEQQAQARANIDAQVTGDYAVINGDYPNMSVGKAIADADGNVITDTYATKDEITNSVTADVICSHEYEITGNTGDEHGLAVSDQQMLLTKIQGQTRRKSLNLMDFEKIEILASTVSLIKENGSLIATSKGSYGYIVFLFVDDLVIGKQYTISLDGQFTSNESVIRFGTTTSPDDNTYGEMKFGTSYERKSIRFIATSSNLYVTYYVTTTSNEIYNVATKDLMLNFGDVAMPYESYDDTLVSSKCNFLSTGQNYANLTVATDLGNNHSMFDLGYLPAGTYYIKTNGGGDQYLYKNSEIISSNLKNGESFTLTELSGLSIDWYQYNSESTVMLNYGNTAQPYEPYKAENLPFNVSLGQWDYWQADNIKRQTSPIQSISAGGALPSGLTDGNFVCNIPGITTIDELTAYVASNSVQIAYKLATPTNEAFPFAGGYAVYEGGLQQQVTETLPYLLNKRYSLNVAAQLLANVEIDREQQAQISQHATEISDLQVKYDELIANLPPHISNVVFNTLFTSWSRSSDSASSGSSILYLAFDGYTERGSIDILPEDAKANLGNATIVRTSGDAGIEFVYNRIIGSSVRFDAMNTSTGLIYGPRSINGKPRSASYRITITDTNGNNFTHDFTIQFRSI